MFLIITALAAIISTIIWHVNAPEDKYRLSSLCFIYWGATLMWFVDHVIAYITEGREFVEITLNAALLGASVVLLGLLMWAAMLILRDYKRIFRKLLKIDK